MNNLEDAAGYVPGGYNPVLLGTKLDDGRYEIVHKLGHGLSSTVWLAKDTKRKQWVAIKILVARRSDQGAKLGDLKSMKRMAQGSRDHPGRRHVVRFLATFHVTGPNGRHLCLVTEALGYKLDNLRIKDALLPLPVAREAAKQLVLGIDYIHSCGIVHGGNILVRSKKLPWPWNKGLKPEIWSWPASQKVIKLDDGYTDVSHLANLPSYFVYPFRPAHNLAVDAAGFEIVIADFSEATLVTSSSSAWMGSYVLRPPEGICELEINPTADIWTFGCILWEILGEGNLFNTWPAKTDMILSFIDVVGPLPAHLAALCTEINHQQPADENSQDAVNDLFSRNYSLDDRKEFMKLDRENFPDDELDAVVELLKDILVYDPNARLTPNQILESRWMQNWVLRGKFIAKRDSTEWRELHMKLPAHSYN